MNNAKPTLDELLQFYAALPHGRANAITARQLAQRLGIASRNSDRVLRHLAQHAVGAGMLVCADNSGYFVPESGSEARESLGRLRSQAAHMSDRARRMQSLIDHVFGEQGRLL